MMKPHNLVVSNPKSAKNSLNTYPRTSFCLVIAMKMNPHNLVVSNPMSAKNYPKTWVLAGTNLLKSFSCSLTTVRRQTFGALDAFLLRCN